MKLQKLLFYALLACSASAKAQTAFTANQFERFSTLTPSQLQWELLQKSFYVATKDQLPNNELQVRYKTNTDPETVFLAIFVNGKITIIDYESTFPSVQEILKKSLLSDGFVFKETSKVHGEQLVKYMKDGGIAKSGVEIQYGVNYSNGQKHYSTMLWNWRGYKSKYGSINHSAAIVAVTTNELDGNYQSGSHRLAIKNGKAAICLMGQQYINAIIKKVGADYQLFFVSADKTQYSAGANWKDYSTVQNIASLTLNKPAGEIKMDWKGLWNIKTYKWDYDDGLDGDPNTKLTFKKAK